MLRANQTIKNNLENELTVTDCGYLKLEFKEEVDPKDISLDAENKTCQPQLLLESKCIKVEPEDQDDIKEFYSEVEGNKKVIEFSKGRQESEDLKKLFQFHISIWEAEQILNRRKQNRERKALKRAQETEEQRKLRREKERLAKAAVRAAEPLEKRMMRREKDRIAKALSRARETEEQRRHRLEKNRLAMATLRAAQSEEEKLIRREKDRIKKAAMRELETEEQKRSRREKNRIAVAVKRRSLFQQEKKYVRLKGQFG